MSTIRGTRIPDATIQRGIELLALGLSQRETAKAIGIALSTFQNRLSEKKWRDALAEEEKKRGAADDLESKMIENVRLLANATKSDGSPDLDRRGRAVETYFKHQERFPEAIDTHEALPGGVVLLYPDKPTGTPFNEFRCPNPDCHALIYDPERPGANTPGAADAAAAACWKCGTPPYPQQGEPPPAPEPEPKSPLVPFHPNQGSLSPEARDGHG